MTHFCLMHLFCISYLLKTHLMAIVYNVSVLWGFFCLPFFFLFLFFGGVRFFFLFLNAVQATDDTFLKMKKKMKTIGMENAVT